VAELLHAKSLELIPDKVSVSGRNVFLVVGPSCANAQTFDPNDKKKILWTTTLQHNGKQTDDMIRTCWFCVDWFEAACPSGCRLGNPCVQVCLLDNTKKRPAHLMKQFSSLEFVAVLLLLLLLLLAVDLEVETSRTPWL